MVDLVQRDFASGGDTRHYYFIPDPNDTGHGRCMIILHGGGSNGLKVTGQGALLTQVVSGALPFHLMVPEGWPYNLSCVTPTPAAAFKCGGADEAHAHKYWDDGRLENMDTLSGVGDQIKRDDAAFLGAFTLQIPTIALAFGGIVINPAKIAIWGASNGANMAQKMAIEQRSKYAALGIVAGAIAMTYVPSPPTAIHAYMVHGSEDPRLFVNGGNVTANGIQGRVRPHTQTLAFWQRVNGVMASGAAVPAATVTAIPNTDTTDGSYAESRDWYAGTKKLRYIRVTGGGHTIPGNPLVDPDDPTDENAIPGSYNNDFQEPAGFGQWCLTLSEFA